MKCSPPSAEEYSHEHARQCLRPDGPCARDTCGAAHYSTFGGANAGKLDFRWEPINDLAIRGTVSKGFRAPNLGELYGLTQFAPTLIDPCGPTSGVVLAQYAAGCTAQHVPPGFVQANTQITVFTGGNAQLKPGKSDSYTAGLQYRARWVEGGSTDKLSGEATYHHHKVTGGIQAGDLQAELNNCLASGGVGGTNCAPFSRTASGNLNPPQNFLQNLGAITTSGIDLKADWIGARHDWGRLTTSLQATEVIDYKAVEAAGNVAQRQAGIEVTDSAIPKLRANAQLGWAKSDWQVSWILRYIDAVKEACPNATITNVPGCSNGQEFHSLQAVLYHDLPGAFWNVRVRYKF